MGIDVSHFAIANSKSKACVDCSQMLYTFVFMTCLTLAYVMLNLYLVTGR